MIGFIINNVNINIYIFILKVIILKNHNNEWVLSKIYQHDELDKIPIYN